MTESQRHWLWPLPGAPRNLPVPGADGAFGVVRKHEVHSGVDLYCVEDDFVIAIDDGSVVGTVTFTGILAGSPWWNPTFAVIIDHGWGVVLYGEIAGQAFGMDMPGHKVERGQYIGSVKRVRPKDSDKPHTMLHLELWRDAASVLVRYKGDRAQEPNDWPLGDPCPDGLLDPTPFLQEAEGAERRNDAR